MNMFLLQLCPCRSNTAQTLLPWIEMSSSSIVLKLTSYQLDSEHKKINTVGWKNLFGRSQNRFRSSPLRLVLKLPITTPSMLIIGTILNSKSLFRKIALGFFESNFFMIPSHTKLLADSEGCALAMMQTIGLLEAGIGQQNVEVS